MNGSLNNATIEQVSPELKEISAHYLAMLLDGQRHEAAQLIMKAVEEGVPVKDIYLHVFQASQYEIGQLWQDNKISVAQEHFCTAATQLIMSQLYPHIFTTDRIGHRMVATCVGGELHEMGIRMVTDFFEMDGWDTYYLGANTPTVSIIEAIDERNAELLAISAAMTFNITAVRELITAVRDHKDDGIKILVGGRPFNISHALWASVHADGYAPDAQKALSAAYELLGISL